MGSSRGLGGGAGGGVGYGPPGGPPGAPPGHNLVCILYVKQRGGRHWKEVGRTEPARNPVEPEWEKTFQLEYFFEEKQAKSSSAKYAQFKSMLWAGPNNMWPNKGANNDLHQKELFIRR